MDSHKRECTIINVFTRVWNEMKGRKLHVQTLDQRLDS